MKGTSIKGVIKIVGNAINKHSPVICLTIAGVLGATAIVTAVIATPKAMETKKKEEDIREEKELEPMTKVETVVKCGKYYIPSAICFIGSVGFMFTSYRIQAARMAALMSAYTMSTDEFKKYKEKVQEKFSKTKVKELQDDINTDKLLSTPIPPSYMIPVIGKGSTLCLDAYNGRYFRCDIDMLKRAINEFNARIWRSGDDFLYLNEFYDILGLAHTGNGDQVGWGSRDGLFDLNVEMTSCLTEDDTPALVYSFSSLPSPREMYF